MLKILYSAVTVRVAFQPAPAFPSYHWIQLWKVHLLCHFYVASRMDCRPLRLPSRSMQSGLVCLLPLSLARTLALSCCPLTLDLTCLVLFLVVAFSAKSNILQVWDPLCPPTVSQPVTPSSLLFLLVHVSNRGSHWLKVFCSSHSPTVYALKVDPRNCLIFSLCVFVLSQSLVYFGYLII